MQQGTTTELNLADYFRANNMSLKTVTFATADEAVKAYDTSRCDSYTTDSSGLYGERLRLTDPSAHIVLPEIISKEPLSPAVRQGDDTWEDIVRWIHYAMINAEELGVNQKNVDDMLKSDAPDIRRLLGVEGQFGQALGSAMTGPIASSRPWAITAKASSAMSAKARRSRSRAVSMRCGPKAACNTGCRCAERRARRHAPRGLGHH